MRETLTIPLPDHVLESIFRKLPPKALGRAKALSNYWKSVAESLLSALTKAPSLLILPRHGTRTACVKHFINLPGNTAPELMRELTSNVFNDKLHCLIGSSRGQLIFLNKRSLAPILFNPFTEARIPLPSLKPTILKIDKMLRVISIPKPEPWKNLVRKVIFTTEPSSVEFGVVLSLFYKQIGHIALFYKNGDISWSMIGELSSVDYHDFICSNNKLYGLRNVLEIWDLLQDGRPRNRRRGDSVGFTSNFLQSKANSVGIRKCIYSRYLVESGGEVMAVVRLTDYISWRRHSKTKLFYVCKYDEGKGMWVELESLGDQSLFLGRNHSASISSKDVRANSIYFTSDIFQHLSRYKRPTFEVGIYNMEDKSVLELSSESLPAVWITPN